MAQDHKILKVSQEAPRVWNKTDANGNIINTIYYIKVMLEGHNKPVEVGKKKPDALKAGDTVYGDIESTSYPNDKFKAAQKPNASFGGGASKPAYQAKDEHAIAKAVALKAAVDFHAHGTKKDTNVVLADADMFLTWLKTDDKSLDTSPDPMSSVHAQNPMNQAAAEEFVDEPFNTQDLPPGF